VFVCKSCGALNKVKPDHEGSPVCGRCKATLDVSGTPQEVDGAALIRIVEAATVPVLVDFWAPWCGPCRAVAPIVEQLARENAGRLITLKLNTDQNPVAANSYNIQGIPTFILFNNGRIAGRQSGAMPKQAFASWLSELEPASAQAAAQA
jgi:thioredoxin 2